ncbi:MAG: regulatory protein RecX [Candidatus Paceibacterota bacterium]
MQANEEEKNKAMKFAMKLIGLRKRSVFEIETRLKEKGFDRSLAQEVIAELRKFKYLDDESFAESYINDRVNFRPAGKFVIRNELKKRGISTDVIENKLKELLDSEKELSLAENLIRKKIKIINSREPQRIRNKLLYALRSRGFSSEIISQALQNTLELDENINSEDY